jgi:hypothetical protein
MHLVRIDVSEERIASIIRATRIGGLGIALVVTSIGSNLQRNFFPSSDKVCIVMIVMIVITGKSAAFESQPS